VSERLEPPQEGRIKAPLEAPIEKVIAPFVDFVRAQSAGGVILIAAAALAIVLASSNAQILYEDIKHLSLGIQVGEIRYAKSLLHWVNEGLMALFFFLLGLEIKRELVVGELSDPRRSLTVVAAAAGGMLAPAIVYVAIAGPEHYVGWGVPIATDTAFALAILILLRRFVSPALRAFLIGFAILDDLGAIAVVAIFYTASLNWALVGLAGILVFAGLICNLMGARAPLVYLLVGVGVWISLLESGIHGTVAGVVMAAIAPMKPVVKQAKFVEIVRDRLRQFRAAHRRDRPIIEREQQQAMAEEIRDAAVMVTTPLRRWERRLDAPVSLVILPVFAFLNAGLHLELTRLAGFVGHPVFLGVAGGLLIGKPVGVWASTFVAVRLGLCDLPDGVRFSHVAGVALLAGIGFTMSVFIAGLAFPSDAELLDTAKAAILASSVVAALVGFLWLRIGGALARR
jgi:NhaA family Na+:H+ antiporter